MYQTREKIQSIILLLADLICFAVSYFGGGYLWLVVPITYLQLYSLLIIGSILMLFDHVVVLFKHLAAIQTGVEEEAE